MCSYQTGPHILIPTWVTRALQVLPALQGGPQNALNLSADEVVSPQGCEGVICWDQEKLTQQNYGKKILLSNDPTSKLEVLFSANNHCFLDFSLGLYANEEIFPAIT